MDAAKVIAEIDAIEGRVAGLEEQYTLLRTVICEGGQLDPATAPVPVLIAKVVSMQQRASESERSFDECEAECAKLRTALFHQDKHVAELEADAGTLRASLLKQGLRVAELEEAAQYPPPMERREAALLDMLREAQAEVVRLRLAAVGGGR